MRSESLNESIASVSSLVGRIVGVELEHLPLGVVRRVGARIFVHLRHLGIELPRLSDHVRQFLKRDGQHESRQDLSIR